MHPEKGLDSKQWFVGCGGCVVAVVVDKAVSLSSSGGSTAVDVGAGVGVGVGVFVGVFVGAGVLSNLGQFSWANRAQAGV